MAERWSVDRVVAAAPDSKAEVAGRKLATPAPWSGTGQQGAMVWGECRGSSKTPYKVSVDTQAPAYRCSCPSRKFPCKHALGLLFLWAQGQLAEDGSVAEPPSWAPRPREAKPEPAEPKERTPEQIAAAAARLAQREERVTGGLADLVTWIDDQVAHGLAGSVRAGWAEHMAARMVDAQAPGVAAMLRSLPEDVTGDPAELLGELGLIRLLATTWPRRDALADDLRATVRAHVGFSLPQAEVVADQPGVRDRWVVVGLHDIDDDERVTTRRVWLRGIETGRWALVLLFAAAGTAFDAQLTPGTVHELDLHFFPGVAPMRAAVGRRHADSAKAPAWVPDAGTAAQVRRAYADALALDPWLGLWPVAVRGRLGRVDDAWAVTDETGQSLRVVGPEKALWGGLARTTSRTVSILGEWSAEGLNPLAFGDADVSDGRLVIL
ncbi:SWIM zinc finger family protein [Mariniluteicoccus endophyticus]